MKDWAQPMNRRASPPTSAEVANWPYPSPNTPGAALAQGTPSTETWENNWGVNDAFPRGTEPKEAGVRNWPFP